MTFGIGIQMHIHTQLVVKLHVGPKLKKREERKYR